MKKSLLSLFWTLAFFLCANDALAEGQDNVLTQHKLVAHALGSIDGHRYTNSLEAFLINYKNGKRVFEVDLIQTADGQVICMHEGLERLIGIEKSITKTPFADVEGKNFLGQYTLLDLNKLLDLIEKYNDIYIITDTKNENDTILAKVVMVSKSRKKDVIDRVIPQVYSIDDYKKTMAMYGFKRKILTLYMTNLTDEEVYEFAKNNKIDALTVSKTRFTLDLMKKMLSINLPVFVHTVNDPAEMECYESMGVSGFYTDYLER